MENDPTQQASTSMSEFERKLRLAGDSLSELAALVGRTDYSSNLSQGQLIEQEDVANEVLNRIIPLVDNLRGFRTVVGTLKVDKRIARRNARKA